MDENPYRPIEIPCAKRRRWCDAMLVGAQLLAWAGLAAAATALAYLFVKIAHETGGSLVAMVTHSLFCMLAFWIGAWTQKVAARD